MREDLARWKAEQISQGEQEAQAAAQVVVSDSSVVASKA